MADDFIRINPDANDGEPPRALYDAIKSLRQAREQACRPMTAA
jgi:hypothetical protein